MFGWLKKDKKSTPALFDYYIQLNLQSLRNWMGSETEIGYQSKWSASDPGVVDIVINYLPTLGVHFHRMPRVFSESIAGQYRSADDLDIEWSIFGNYFTVFLPTEDTVIFRCPVQRASQMLTTGHNATKNLRGESNLTTVESANENEDEQCRKVLEKTWHRYSLSYSNDLVRVVFEVAPANNVLYYNSYLESH